MWIWIFLAGLIIGGTFGVLVMGVFIGARVNECRPRAKTTGEMSVTNTPHLRQNGQHGI